MPNQRAQAFNTKMEQQAHTSKVESRVAYLEGIFEFLSQHEDWSSVMDKADAFAKNAALSARKKADDAEVARIEAAKQEQIRKLEEELRSLKG